MLRGPVVLPTALLRLLGIVERNRPIWRVRLGYIGVQIGFGHVEGEVALCAPERSKTFSESTSTIPFAWHREPICTSTNVRNVVTSIASTSRADPYRSISSNRRSRTKGRSRTRRAFSRGEGRSSSSHAPDDHPSRHSRFGTPASHSPHPPPKNHDAPRSYISRLQD